MCIFIASMIKPFKNWDPVKIDDKKKLNQTGCAIIIATFADAFISITGLVIGVLGLVGILQGLPPALAYTCIGLSSTILFIWLVISVCSKGKHLYNVKELLKAAMSSDPELKLKPLYKKK